LSTFDKVP